MSKKPRHVEYIEWLDHMSHNDAGWKKVGEVRTLKPVLCKSVGFLVSENKTEITVIGSLIESEDECDGEVCILKSCIVKRERLK